MKLSNNMYMVSIASIFATFKFLSKASLRNGVYFVIFSLCLSSCKKFLEIEPPLDKFEVGRVFENDETATSAVTGIYSKMAADGFASGDRGSISVLAGLSADEFISHSALLDGIYKNEIPTNDPSISRLWSYGFNYIYVVNSILEGLPLSTAVSEKTKIQLQGEARFIRAFCYLNMVNLFGDVPLILKTDYRDNQSVSKTSKDIIYSQIIVDLLEAEKLLGPSYITGERLRPNKWAAAALLARVYLYNQRWDDAAKKATEIINQNGTYSLVADLNQVFIKNSTEAIWQLMPRAGRNTNEAGTLILIATPLNVSLSPNLIAAFTDADDTRKSKWIGQFKNSSGTYNYPFKYKIRPEQVPLPPVSEYSMVIRLAEMYLVRAEARSKLNLQDLALEDINLIRKRAGITKGLTGLNQTQNLIEVEKQRRLELFSEWGHRWFDLKRTGLANTVLAPIKGSTWKATDVLYPIPDAETSINGNIAQNAGY